MSHFDADKAYYVANRILNMISTRIAAQKIRAAHRPQNPLELDDIVAATTAMRNLVEAANTALAASATGTENQDGPFRIRVTPFESDGSRNIDFIKAMRACYGVGLKEAKVAADATWATGWLSIPAAVDQMPTIAKFDNPDDANSLIALLKSYGASDRMEAAPKSEWDD